MTTLRYASHTAHARAQDHRVRFALGAVVVMVGAALWLADMACSLIA